MYTHSNSSTLYLQKLNTSPYVCITSTGRHPDINSRKQINMCTWLNARAIDTTPLINPTHQTLTCENEPMSSSLYKYFNILEQCQELTNQIDEWIDPYSI
jgi:hypothetical protein